MADNVVVLHAETNAKDADVLNALKNDPEFQELLDFNDSRLVATVQEALFTSHIVDQNYAEQVKKLVSTFDTLIEFELANYGREKGYINKVYGADDIMPLKMKCLIKATCTGKNKVDLELLTTEMAVHTFHDFNIDMSDTDEMRFEVLQGISKLAHEWLIERKLATGTVWWPKADFNLKVLVLGPVAVGKTCTQIRFHKDEYKVADVTLGTDKTTSLIELPNKCKVKVDIWDTAGSERFNAVTSSMLRGADGVMLVYDTTDPKMTKDAIIGDGKDSIVNKHYLKLRQQEEAMVPIVYLGNKTDLPSSRMSIPSDVKEVCHFTGSALTGENIKRAYNQLLYDSAMLKYNRRRYPGGADYKESPTVAVNSGNAAAASGSGGVKKGGCCG